MKNLRKNFFTFLSQKYYFNRTEGGGRGAQIKSNNKNIFKIIYVLKFTLAYSTHSVELTKTAT